MIALFLLAGEASDNSPLAIAGVLATRSFTFAPLEPLTGMLADRYPRKWLMVLGNVWSFTSEDSRNHAMVEPSNEVSNHENNSWHLVVYAEFIAGTSG